MESPDAAQLSARRTMERADLALQLHAILDPKLAESGQEKRLPRNRIAAPARPRRDGKRRHPPRPRRARGSRQKIARATSRGSKPPSTGTPEPPSTSARPSSSAKSSSANSPSIARTPRKPRPASTPPTKQTLTALAPLHPIVAEVLEYREASKLLSTYIDALPASICRRRPHPHHLLPTRHQHGPAQFAGPQSAEHPDPHRAGPRNPPRLRPARGRLHAALRRLLADRAAHPRRAHAGPRPARGAHQRRGHPPRHRGARLRPARRRGHQGRSATRRRWSTTASATASPRSDCRSGSASRAPTRKISSTATSRNIPASKST